MSRNLITRRQALAMGAAATIISCAPAAAPSSGGSARQVAKLNYLFGFFIQANPTLPVIVAKEMGFYKQMDLDVTWDFQTTSTAVRLVATNQYHGGSSDPQTLAGFVKEGLPLVTTAQLSQNSVRAFAVRKGEPIKRPKDFEGKKVGIKGTLPWPDYLAILASDKADRSKITEVPVGFSSVELKEKRVDVLPIFLGNEPFVLKNQLQTEIDIIHPKDFGYPAMGTPLISNKNFIKDNKDVYTRFVRATLKGSEYMIDNRAETLQIAIQYGGTATTKQAHEFIYDVTLPTMKHPKGTGYIDKAQYQTNLDVLADLKLLDHRPKVDDLVDDSFWNSVMKDGKVVWPG
ncbi:MAG: ABC transporter substrate-binding protein [Chloroflexi bacterium]|nr:ABC transporter substrate-binding protein [Chloroflexota bacterium]